MGTVYDLHSAKRWLAGTFLAVRLGHNPDHYKLDGDSRNLSLDERIERICQRDLRLLEDNDLLCTKGTEAKLKCTEFGDAMARYCIKFETMRILLSLGPKPKISEIVCLLFHVCISYLTNVVICRLPSRRVSRYPLKSR